VHLLVAAILCLCGLNGCTLGFVWQASVGQIKLLTQRQPIEQVLQNGARSIEEQQKLRLVLDVRAFAIDDLGLRAHKKSYTTFVDVGGPYVSYNVSAALKDTLQPYVWRFPIVGQVPYKGFFSQAAAQRLEQKLIAQGYDTYLRGVRAYSTLGYFGDPILSSMLAYHDFDLINTIIHELVHQTVWIKGSVSFNESLASFIADQATRVYLARRDGVASPAYQLYLDLHADAAVFQAYMHEILARLEVLYAAPISREEKLRRREQVFLEAREAYPAIFPRLKTQRYQRFFEQRRLNNAVLLSFRRYHQDTTFFERTFVSQGRDIRRMIAYVKTLQADDIPETFRTP
jgi:predicted aminopeptidase